MEEKNRKINIKIFPLYKMISWDLLFYYSTIFLFLTQVKDITASQFFLSEAFYTVSKFVSQVPITILVDKLGKRNSLITGNILITMGMFMILTLVNFNSLLLAQLLWALGYTIKGIVESNILYDSLPEGKKRGPIFSKIDGKASSYYYYVDAITAFSAGFLYVINPYIPIICSLLLCIISSVLSFRFKEIKKDEIKKEKNRNSVKDSIKQLKYSVRYIFKSKRLSLLIIFFGIFSGVLSICGSLRGSLLTDLKVPEQYFGVIVAMMQLASGIGSKNQEKIQNRFKNRTLALLSIPTTVTCILIGFMSNSLLPIKAVIIFVVIMLLIQSTIKGPFYILMDRYLKNFTDSNMRTRIDSIKNFLGSVSSTLMNLIISFLLSITNTANAYIIIGSICTVTMVLLLDYMRGKVGLKAEEYKKSEINFVEIK